MGADKPFSWQDEQELMERLGKAQNRIRGNTDVMTFAALCKTREQLERHVISCEETAAEYDRQR